MPPVFSKQESNVDLGRPDTLRRSALCRSIITELTQAKRGIIYGSPGSGKTSFGTVLHSYLVDSVPTDATGRTQYAIDSGDMAPVTCELVSLKAGLRADSTQDYLQGRGHVTIHSAGVAGLFAAPQTGLKVVVLDEAQVTYGEGWGSLWATIAMIGPPIMNVCVLVLAAYGRKVLNPIPSYGITPTTFTMSYNGDILKFSKDEIGELYTTLGTMLQFPLSSDRRDEVRDAVFELTEGVPLLVVGLYHCMRDHLKDRTPAEVNASAVRTLLSPTILRSMLVQRAMVGFKDLKPWLARGGDHQRLNESLLIAKQIVLRLFVDGALPSKELEISDTLDADVESAMVKCGMLKLVDDGLSVGFNCPLQYMYLFTTYAKEQSTSVNDPIPDNLPQLVVESLELLDGISLRHSLGRGVQGTPLERTWQMEFFRGITARVGDQATVSPDVGTVFGSSGYVDFYIQTRNKAYMVELVREGSQLQQHIGRFRGRGPYTRIAHHDWLIVDFYTLGPLHIPRTATDPHVWHFGYFPDFSGGILTRQGQASTIYFQGSHVSRFWKGISRLVDVVRTALD
ncbi:hypothetical protein HDU85_003959 [Gaertneriomyces sp. JEL0708]|nr:hypothetical protein HDU85_003959 [Gaertneriomyces sp. JEL0708]